MTRGCKAPPTRPNARGPRSEHPRTRTPRIRKRARPGGNLQRKNGQPVSRGPQGRRAAPPLLRRPDKATMPRSGPGWSRHRVGERRRRRRAGLAGALRERSARTRGRQPGQAQRGGGGLPGALRPGLATPTPAPAARARLLLPTHLPGSPARAQPQPVPPAAGPGEEASARPRQGYEVHGEEDERAAVEEREDEHHRLHPPPRPPPVLP